MGTKNKDEEWPETNREKAKKPRGRGHWCYACDGAIVRNGQKCPCCGVTQLPKRDKKW